MGFQRASGSFTAVPWSFRSVPGSSMVFQMYCRLFQGRSRKFKEHSWSIPGDLMDFRRGPRAFFVTSVTFLVTQWRKEFKGDLVSLKDVSLKFWGISGGFRSFPGISRDIPRETAWNLMEGFGTPWNSTATALKSPWEHSKASKKPLSCGPETPWNH